MCGRFAQSSPTDRYYDLFGLFGRGNLLPRYNVAPSLAAIACVEPEPGWRHIVTLKWGFVPHWARGLSGPKPINARAETLFDKPMFRDSARGRRCLIPAEGFYEWRSEGRGKQPYFIRTRDGEPMAFAGLWDRWQRDGQNLPTCTIVVTEANALVRPIHDRMPVILPRSAWDLWLDPTVHDVSRLAPLLVPFDALQMEAYPVSREVNSPANEGPQLIEPIHPPLL